MSSAPDTLIKIFTDKRSEFGMYEFADPHIQATYKPHETLYKAMLQAKNAYDTQELLQRMCADIEREYLTRMEQIKRLQMDAAVDFRNAESSLKKHYASEVAADHRPYIHEVDIHAPLVSKIQLADSQIFDLETFNEKREFERLLQIHADLLADSYKGDEAVVHHGRAFTWSELVAGGKKQQQEEEEEPQGRYGDGGLCGCDDLDCSDCYSYDSDSDYCGWSDSYPRECNYEREQREAEEAEAAAQAAAEQQRWEENARNSDEEARANEAEHRREVAGVGTSAVSTADASVTNPMELLKIFRRIVTACPHIGEDPLFCNRAFGLITSENQHIEEFPESKSDNDDTPFAAASDTYASAADYAAAAADAAFATAASAAADDPHSVSDFTPSAAADVTPLRYHLQNLRYQGDNALHHHSQ